MARKVVLVTGGGGQVACEIADLKKEYTGLNIHLLSKQELDITDRSSVRAQIAKLKPDYIINTAAYTHVDQAESDPEKCYSINAHALQIIGHEAKLAKVIHLSTDYVYGQSDRIPIKEDHATSPVSVYAKSKLSGEKILAGSHNHFLIIRTSWLYSTYGKNFVKTMVRLGKTKSEINVVSDQIGSPTYAFDLAGALLEIIAQDSKGMIDTTLWNQIYHYANLGQASWYDITTEIKNKIDPFPAIYPIPTYAYPTPAQRPSWSVLSTNKISQAFHLKMEEWKPRLWHCLNRIIN